MRVIIRTFSLMLVACAISISFPEDLFSQEDSGRRDRGGDRGGSGRPTFGQGGFTGGGPGGGFSGGRRNGPGGGGLLGEVQNEGTRSEINLTEDQFSKLQEIGESSNNRDQFGDIFGRMQTAASEEERTLIREELRVKMEDARKEAEDKMKAVLSKEQFQRLDQIRLHREGSRALGREEIQTELALTEDQKAQLVALQEERSTRYRELGFQATEEDREKLRVELEQKTLGILTEAQKTQWQQKLGPPPTSTVDPRRPVFVRPGEGTAGPPQRPRQIVIEEVPEGAEAVMSFGTKSETPLDSTATGPVDKTNLRLSFNFRYAPWSEVLRLFAREAGLSLDLQNVPPGTFSYYDQKSYTPKDALDVLNGYLLPKGYVLVHRDDFLVSLNIDDAIPPNLIPKVRPEDLSQRGRNELLTVTFPLEGVDAAQIAAEINEVKGPQGKVVALSSANAILVTDIGSNLMNIDTMLKEMIGRPGPDDLSFKPYQIKNLPASEAEDLLRSVLGVGSSVANVSAGGSTRSRTNSASPVVTIAADQRTNKLLISANTKTHLLIEQALLTIDVEGEPSNFSAAANKPFLRVYSVTSADAREVVKTIDALMPGIVVNEDGRNGKIHIMASPDKHAEVDNLIRQMDGMGGASQQITVIPLAKMDPLIAAATVRAMFLKDGELAPTIEAGVYGRQLMVRGDANQILQVKGLLSQLGEDGTGIRETSNESRLRTIPLSGRDPSEILPLLQRMWNQQSSSPIRIINPNERGPVRGIITPGEGQSIRDRVEPSPAPASTHQQQPVPENREAVQSHGTKQFRSVPVLTASQTTVVEESASAPDTVTADVPNEGLNNTPSKADSQLIDPQNLTDQQLLDLLEMYINRTGTQQSPAEEPFSPLTPAPTSSANAPGTSSSGANSSGVAQPGTQSSTNTNANLNFNNTADVTVTIMGDELMLYSSDPEALNRFEELLESTLQAIPSRTSWTVFTLQTADATEASMMLQQLLPYSSVSSSSSGGGMLGSLSGAASSLGSGLAEMTGLSSISAAGQSLKIIPDVRLNALFVSGPAAQVQEVGEMLRVLDASEWPDSFRNKVTRLIPVEFAEADDVLRMVKESYKVYIDPPQQQGRGNPLAAMMGGGGGRGGRDGESPESQIKMTVSADTNTNQLVVWSDEPLFREVEGFVQSIDKAAEEAKRTVRVVSLQNTNSKVIQGALGTLMPRVNVSSTGSRRPSTDSSNSSQNNTPPASNADQDRIRQFMEQRMREREAGGDTGGRTGGFGGFGGFGAPGGGFGAPGGVAPSGGGRPTGGDTGRGGTGGGTTSRRSR